MDDVKIPGEPLPVSPTMRTLTIVASGLTAASLTVNLLLQVADFMRKRPMEPDQRDRAQAAALTLRVLRQMPGLIKQVRLFIDQVRPSTSERI
jgi:hypothetical protein